MTVHEEWRRHETNLAVHPLLRRQPAVATTLLLTLGVAGWAAARTGGENPRPGRTLVASAAPTAALAVDRKPAGEGPTAAVAPVAPKEAAPVATKAAAPAVQVQTAPAIIVPPNPFLPTEPDPLPEPPKADDGALLSTDPAVEEAVPGLSVGEGGIPSLPPVDALATLPGAKGLAIGAAPKVAPNRASALPEIIGIVQGEPALAVVKSEGQSFYLKIGDQIADTWRLEAIKERSVILRLGGRRVEIPIQGGNS